MPHSPTRGADSDAAERRRDRAPASAGRRRDRSRPRRRARCTSGSSSGRTTTSCWPEHAVDARTRTARRCAAPPAPCAPRRRAVEPEDASPSATSGTASPRRSSSAMPPSPPSASGRARACAGSISTISSTMATGTTKRCAAALEGERVDDRDGERHAEHERVPSPGRVCSSELAAELLDGDALHDVHAHAAAARRRRLIARREAGQDRSSSSAASVSGRGWPARRATASRSMPRPSSATVSSSCVLERSKQAMRDRALLGLARAPPLRRAARWRGRRALRTRWTIAGKMRSATRLVELGVAGVDLEPHLLAGRAREAAHEERDALEQLGDAHHAHAQDRGAQIAQLARVVGHDLGRARARRRPSAASAATARARRKRVTTSAESFSIASSRRATLDAHDAACGWSRRRPASNGALVGEPRSAGAAGSAARTRTSPVVDPDRLGERLVARPPVRTRSANASPPGASSLGGTDSGTTLTISRDRWRRARAPW